MSLINPGDFPIDPNTVDGTELASRLNRLKLAIFSGLSNATRPPDITAGGVWGKLVSPGVYQLMQFDGVADNVVGIGDIQSQSLALPFDIATNYKTGDLIWDEASGTLLSAKYAIASGSAFNAGDWNTDATVQGSFLHLTGGTLTGLLKLAPGAAIASAATVDLTNATGNTVHITGTTGINAWTLTAGQVMDVIFDGILTLTHHATANNLPGAVNITTAAGGRARIFYDGTTVYVLSYTRAEIVSQAIAEAGTDTQPRAWSAERITQAIRANASSFGGTVALSGSVTAIPDTVPLWAKKITLSVMSMSLTGTDDVLIQFGDSSGYSTTGYASTCGNSSASSTGVSTASAGFKIRLAGAGQSVSGIYTFTRHGSGNAWVGAYAGKASTTTAQFGGGDKTLADVLTNIRFTRDGTDTFDGGTVAWIFEG